MSALHIERGAIEETATADWVAQWLRCRFTWGARALEHCAQTHPKPISKVTFCQWVKACSKAGVDLLGPPLPKPDWRDTKHGLVYFAEAVGAERIKIGFTAGKTTEARLKTLQTGCPFLVREIASMPGTMAVEAELHVRFAKLIAVPGTEWFHARLELRQYIQDVIDRSAT